MDSTTPRTLDTKGRIALAEARAKHGPDSEQARTQQVRINFNEAVASLKIALAKANFHEARYISQQIRELLEATR